MEKALEYLLADFELLKEKETYMLDLIDVKKQVLSNNALALYKKLVAAYKAKDIKAFAERGDEFLEMIREADSLLDTVPCYRLETWLNMARKASEGLGEETEKLFIENAKKLITTWGDEAQSEAGCLHDYSNRQWSGLTGTLYYKRWAIWIENRKKELSGEKPEKEKFYEIEREWAEG